MTESIFALVGTIFAGVGLKLFEWLVNRKAERLRMERELHADKKADRTDQIVELKEELVRLRALIESYEDEMLQWREKYWSLREERVDQMTQLNQVINSIKELDDDESLWQVSITCEECIYICGYRARFAILPTPHQ